jgi:hypothetical protein
MVDFSSDIAKVSDKIILALTIYGESRGESIEGQIAVGCVIRNRVMGEKKNYRDICLENKQFSCWNRDDPNYIVLGNICVKINNNAGSFIDRDFNQISYLTTGIMMNYIIDNTHGALNYLSKNLYYSHNIPLWAKNKPIQMIGNQIFLTA